MDVIVAYDISTDTSAGQARLRKIADICSEYGERAQQSVFEIRLSAERLALLTGALTDNIDQHTDSIIIYRVAGDLRQNRTVIGVDRAHRLGEPWIT